MVLRQLEQKMRIHLCLSVFNSNSAKRLFENAVSFFYGFLYMLNSKACNQNQENAIPVVTYKITKKNIAFVKGIGT